MAGSVSGWRRKCILGRFRDLAVAHNLISHRDEALHLARDPSAFQADDGICALVVDVAPRKIATI